MIIWIRHGYARTDLFRSQIKCCIIFVRLKAWLLFRAGGLAAGARAGLVARGVAVGGRRGGGRAGRGRAAAARARGGRLRRRVRAAHRASAQRLPQVGYRTTSQCGLLSVRCRS